MAVVWVPALLRPLTGGQERVLAPGRTIGEVIDGMEKDYPGIRDRLVENGRLRPTIAVAVDGHVSSLKLRQKLNDNSEVHFIPAVSGG
jgi:molybdopterin converting factor small subunit